MPKPILIILSDLFGKEHSYWISFYIEGLSAKFEIIYYDSKTLGEIDLNTNNQEQIHEAFLKTGINRAVLNLIKKEPEQVSILAFSIGGTIAWKATLQGLNIKHLWAVSATRLRYETEKPKCDITLFYGNDDSYKPSTNWFEKQNIDYFIFKNKVHKMYAEPETIKSICNTILKSLT